MRTLDLHPAADRWRRDLWRRDLSLLARMAGMLVGYWTVGARLRRAYRRKEALGEVLWVDEEGPTRHREAPLQRP